MKKLQRLTLDGRLLAVLIICSQLTIPLPLIPITLQTFAIGLLASLLPVVDGLEVVLAYLLLGAVGLPIFANLSSGLAVFVGPTGGYLFSFIAYQLLTAYLLQIFGHRLSTLFWTNCLGAVLSLLLGSLWLIFSLHLALTKALLVGLVPFLLPGLVKILLVVVIAGRLQPIIEKKLAL